MGLGELLAKRHFPKKKKDFWYCGEFNDYQYKRQQQGKPWKTKELELPCDTFLINPFSNAGGKVPDVGDIIPCIKLNGWIGFYEVTDKHNPHTWGDYLPWDDGNQVDLRLHHVRREAR